MGAAASVEPNGPVSLAQARDILQVDATKDASDGGREVVFLQWWDKLPKNDSGEVESADWAAGVRWC